MTQNFDVCVLGSGAVGQTVAYAGRKAGLSVTVLETRAHGGTCPNRGCDAKKPYVNAAGLMHQVNSLQAVKGGIDAAAIRWADIAAFKKTFTDPVGPLTAKDLKAQGIELIDGQPAFINESTLQIGDHQITAERFVIATGQRPRTLDIPGGELTINSDELLELDDLPPHVAFIGGGYIGMEFACAAAMAGHQVTVIATGPHALAGFDPDTVATMEAALPGLGKHGVKIIHNHRVDSITTAPAPAPGSSASGALTVHANDAGATALVTADLVINATGRVASIDGMNLEAAGIASSPRGVVVDGFLRCPGNPRIWAGGDVADNGRPPLIPTAVQDARVLAHNLFKAESSNQFKPRPDGSLASVAFTVPAVAGAGLTEQEARDQHGDDNVHVFSGNLATKKFFRELGQTHASYKYIFDNDHRLLGAHYTGESADETINLLALALEQPGESHPLFNATLTYPSVSAALQTAYRKALLAIR